MIRWTPEVCYILLFKSFESSDIIHKIVILKLGSSDSLGVLGAASVPGLLRVHVCMLVCTYVCVCVSVTGMLQYILLL